MFQQYKFNFPVSPSFCNTSGEISLFVTKRRNTGGIATSLGARTVLPSGLKSGPFLSQTVYIIQYPVTKIHRCVIIFLPVHSLTCFKQGAVCVAPQAELPSCCPGATRHSIASWTRARIYPSALCWGSLTPSPVSPAGCHSVRRRDSCGTASRRVAQR